MVTLDGGACGHACPSFGMIPNFPKEKKLKETKSFKKKKEREKNLNSRCHTKRRAGSATHACLSFGMTTTQDIRELFA